MTPFRKYPPQVSFFNNVLVDLRRVGVRKNVKIEPEKAHFLYSFGGFFSPEGLRCGIGGVGVELFLVGWLINDYLWMFCLFVCI